jgi:hypothetical protein
MLIVGADADVPESWEFCDRLSGSAAEADSVGCQVWVVEEFPAQAAILRSGQQEQRSVGRFPGGCVYSRGI